MIFKIPSFFILFMLIQFSSSMTLCYLASETTNISQISETENSLSLHNEFEV